MKKELRILTPIGMLGYSFSESLFWDAIEEGVDAIILDSGSTDSGPSKLALGQTVVSRQSYRRDLDILVAACQSHRIPVLIGMIPSEYYVMMEIIHLSTTGSAGGDGSRAHVDMFVEIIEDIVRTRGYRSMKVVSIDAELDKDIVRRSLEKRQISPCTPAVPELTESDIHDASRIVAQMGLEPWLKAMKEHPDFDIIVGGRSYDPAPYAAFCVQNGITDLGIAYHMGKILECGALCAKPKSAEAVAIVRNDSFDIFPVNPHAKCTKLSVAAHTLYEKSRPDLLLGPGGALDLTATTYEQLPDGRTVRCRGAKFIPETTYTLKLEGAKCSGYRAIFTGGFRDPILIPQLDSFLDRGKAIVKSKCPFPCDINFHLYGKNALMQSLEPNSDAVPHEVGLVGEARAETQEQATHVTSMARVYCMHAPYAAQKATAGSFGMPTAPFDIPMGPVSEFNIYHIMPVEDPVALFPISVRTIKGADTATTNGSNSGRNATTNGHKPSDLETLNSLRSIASSSTSVSLSPPPPPGTTYLANLASVIRSKNAGPYEITFDIMFSDEMTYKKVKETGVLNGDTVAKLYGVPESEVIWSGWWDPAWAFKATLKRRIVSGSFGDTDAHGSQQHVPFMYLAVPVS
jgi:Domain of unknown function (DUF4387)/Acyclic terpene utilisation family protein AtuA